MSSAEYNALKLRCDQLVERFVNFDIPIDRGPSPDELDQIAAFKLLMHADLEFFIEQRVKFAIDESIKQLKIYKKITSGLFYLIVRWYPWFEKDKNPYHSPCRSDEIFQLAENCLRRANEEISNNNSIKENAFTRLAYSGGLLVDLLEVPLLASLETFGSGRGDVAHGPVGRARSLSDPRIEAVNAKQIVDMLERFDADILASVTP